MKKSCSKPSWLKDYSTYTVNLKRTIVALIFQIGISQNTKCNNSVGFSKLGHVYLWEDEGT